MLGNFDIHNPGNIRVSNDLFKGEVRPSTNNDFKQFVSDDYGYRAMFKILMNYIQKGYNTIFSIIARWAPAFDNNNTADYIGFVSDKMKINPNSLFPDSKLPQLVYYMTWYENGFPGRMDEIQKGYAMLANTQKINHKSIDKYSTLKMLIWPASAFLLFNLFKK